MKIKCPGKVGYSKREAETLVNCKSVNVKSGELRAYYCGKCNAWHLTHKEKKDGSVYYIRLRHKEDFKKYLKQ